MGARLRALLRPLLRTSLRERVPGFAAAWRRAGRRSELRFWRAALARDAFANDDREPFFTTHVGLDRDFYAAKRVLDVGCGPRRELDWATMAAERVGLDPLAERYAGLLGAASAGGDSLDGVRYVSGVAERIPFPDRSFEIVASLNSLDHVDDLERAAAEIKRVLAANGTFILITELGHRPRLTEPQTFSWEVIELFEPELRCVLERRYEDSGAGIDQSVRDAVPFADRGAPRPGVLLARFEKQPG